MTEVVVVSPLTSEDILGLDFLREQEACVDLAERRLRLKSRGCDLPLRDPTTLCEQTVQLVRAAKTVEVPPRSILEVEASIEAPLEGVWLVQEATDRRLPAAVACALVEPTSTTIPLRLLNPRTEPVTVYVGTTLATLEDAEFPTCAVDTVSGRDESVAVDATKQEMLWGLVERAGADLSPGERDILFHLLLSYSDVFASSTADLGRTTTAQHPHRRCAPDSPICPPCVAPASRGGAQTTR